MELRALTIGVALTLILGGAAAPVTGMSAESEEEYTLPISWTWDKTALEVGVVPPGPYAEGPGALYLHDPYLVDVVENAAHDWETAIIDHGSTDISETVRFNVTMIPYGWINADIQAFDIIAVNQETPVPIGGTATKEGDSPCVMTVLPTHQTMTRSPKRIALHEFGHCLGLGHPQDYEPDEDVMAYGSGTCISNLNLDGLSESFAPAFDRAPASSVSMHPDDYEQYC